MDHKLVLKRAVLLAAAYGMRVQLRNLGLEVIHNLDDLNAVDWYIEISTPVSFERSKALFHVHVSTAE